MKNNLLSLRFARIIKPAKKVLYTSSFAGIYAVFGVAVLLTTTLFWALLGAHLQSGNADQLVNSYLFESPSTFHGAFLPSSHSFLIKWPIFMLIKLFGYSSSAFVLATLAVTILTVAALAFIIYRLERRPLIFGTLCLVLASSLLLIPAVPAAGNLLPVNMAMLATRNLEYVAYIGALWLLVRPSFKSRRFWLAICLLGVLIASDRLFLYLTLGGALLALVAYALSKGWNMVSVSVKWLLAGTASAAVAASLLVSVSRHLTHISTQGNLGGPYGLVRTAHDVYLGLIYAGLGFISNFGANPAFDTTIVKNMPHAALSHLVSFGGLALIINLLVVGLGIYACARLLIHSFMHNRSREVELGDSSRLAIMLVWSMLAAVALFIASNHYYAGDARYLTVSLFAVFVALAIFTSQRTWRPEVVTIAGFVTLVGLILAIPTVVHSYNTNKAALAPVNQRNVLVAQALARHPVKVLVGDYWRVIPTKHLATKHLATKHLNVMPLAGCTQPRQVLSSLQWQPDLKKNSFAYLLTLDGNLTDFPNCTLNQVINNYGRPNSSVLVAGTLSHPKELVLFYDGGIHKSAPKTTLKTPSTVLPVALDEIPYLSCRVPTIMNIVAHEDDDLLFMSPDLLDNINAGYCVRTVYITAGDAGAGYYYWLGREQGSQAAYSKMLNFTDIWVERIVQIGDNQYVTVANPRGNPKISLIFMHLPDGNLKGQGFGVNNFESLAKLKSGAITNLNAVYGGSSYTSSSLVEALTSLMQAYSPTEIHTQSTESLNGVTDHSDHNSVGVFTQRAYSQFETERFADKIKIPIKYYLGYTVHSLPVNLTADQITTKENIFMTYSNHDGGVCHSLIQCSRDPAYGIYLLRQYQSQN